MRACAAPTSKRVLCAERVRRLRAGRRSVVQGTGCAALAAMTISRGAQSATGVGLPRARRGHLEGLLGRAGRAAHPPHSTAHPPVAPPHLARWRRQRAHLPPHPPRRAGTVLHRATGRRRARTGRLRARTGRRRMAGTARRAGGRTPIRPGSRGTEGMGMTRPPTMAVAPWAAAAVEPSPTCRPSRATGTAGPAATSSELGVAALGCLGCCVWSTGEGVACLMLKGPCKLGGGHAWQATTPVPGCNTSRMPCRLTPPSLLPTPPTFAQLWLAHAVQPVRRGPPRRRRCCGRRRRHAPERARQARWAGSGAALDFVVAGPPWSWPCAAVFCLPVLVLPSMPTLATSSLLTSSLTSPSS